MYYPKSQIKTNKITQGGEFMLSTTKVMYKGDYWATSQNTFFTGKNPNEGESIKLIPLDETSGTSSPSAHSIEDNLYLGDESYYNARKLGNRNNPPRNPNSTQVLPTEEDYKVGKYTKYFVSKTNEIKFTQVNKSEYLKFKNKSPEVNWSLYDPIELEWLLKGDRKTTFLSNKESVHLLQNKYPGFSLIFKNRYDRFWKI